MSRITILFPLGDYPSNTDGTAREYVMDESLTEVLGQAKRILVHSYVHDKSANNAGAKLRLYHSSLDGRPDEVGEEYGTGLDVSTSGADIQTVEGPFCGRVLAILEVVDTSEPAATQKTFRMEIGVTLILD
ncbi:MAG: hypothetical protein ABIO70_28100 [Pseudomonadota bacterium]